MGWIVASLSGVLIAGIGVREGRADWRAMRAEANGRRIVAFDYLRTQALRLAVCAWWLLLALPLILDGKAVGLNLYTASLIGSNATLALAAFLSLRDRRRLIH